MTSVLLFSPILADRTLPARKNDAKFYYVELFAGIGGFRVALDALGG